MSDDKKVAEMKELVRLAYSLGASEAKLITSSEIPVEDGLEKLCNTEQCKNYGLSPGCPPYVSGPSGFRELQKNLKYAVVFRLSVPLSALLSNERSGIMRLLHEIAAGIEEAAVRAGYSGSKAFAGGSCKYLFCNDQMDCRVLSGGGECLYPNSARPSMSGFGINVSELMKVCGWPSDINAHDREPASESMSWVAGLVLIG